MASTLSMFETVLRRCCPGSRSKASFHTPATRSALLYSSQSRIGNTSKAKRVKPRPPCLLCGIFPHPCARIFPQVVSDSAFVDAQHFLTNGAFGFRVDR